MKLHDAVLPVEQAIRDKFPGEYIQAILGFMDNYSGRYKPRVYKGTPQYFDGIVWSNFNWARRDFEWWIGQRKHDSPYSVNDIEIVE